MTGNYPVWAGTSTNFPINRKFSSLTVLLGYMAAPAFFALFFCGTLRPENIFRDNGAFY